MDTRRPIEFDPETLLVQATILHHTDEELARRVTRAILVERAQRGHFRDPSLELKPEGGILHVAV